MNMDKQLSMQKNIVSFEYISLSSILGNLLPKLSILVVSYEHVHVGRTNCWVIWEKLKDKVVRADMIKIYCIHV